MTRPIDGSSLDEAADTARFTRVDPDATSIYDLRPSPPPDPRVAALRRQKSLLYREIMGLRAALASGWSVGPELAYQELRHAELQAELAALTHASVHS